MSEQESILNSYPGLLGVKSFEGILHIFSLGPHDGIGGTVKRKVYREKLSGKRVVEDTKQFAMTAIDNCNIKGMFEYVYRNLI